RNILLMLMMLLLVARLGEPSTSAHPTSPLRTDFTRRTDSGDDPSACSPASPTPRDRAVRTPGPRRALPLKRPSPRASSEPRDRAPTPRDSTTAFPASS